MSTQPEQQAAPEPSADLRQRITTALDNAHRTNPCTCGAIYYYACFHDGALSHTDRRTAAVLAVVAPELTALRTEADAARAAGYRLAAEMRQLHGADYDTDMLIHSLRNGAELRELAATDPALVQYARATFTTNKILRDAVAAIVRQHKAVPYFDRAICDACSPQRHDGERYNLLITPHPCTTYTTAHNALKDAQ